MKLKSGNILHGDGRIYEYGDGVSRTVSPYAADFSENIEEEIFELVDALIGKGYLTYSSCAGHQAVKRRFVSVAFPSIERAQKFVNHLKEIYESNLISYDLKYPTDYYGVSVSDLGANRDYLNELFCRGYSDYYFVELSIGKNTKPSLRNALQIIRKFLFRELVTFKLVKAVSRIPEYDM